MPVRDLRLIGDPVLRSPTRRVVVFDRAVSALVEDLTDTVALPGRVGLAAPQIGVDLAVFVYDVDGRRGHIVNPVVEEAEGEQSGPEACLSVPGISADTPRARTVTVRGSDFHGDPISVTGHDLLARCLQHETDHLDGVLYLDRLAGAQRRDAMRRLRDGLPATTTTR